MCWSQCQNGFWYCEANRPRNNYLRLILFINTGTNTMLGLSNVTVNLSAIFHSPDQGMFIEGMAQISHVANWAITGAPSSFVMFLHTHTHTQRYISSVAAFCSMTQNTNTISMPLFSPPQLKILMHFLFNLACFFFLTVLQFPMKH